MKQGIRIFVLIISALTLTLFISWLTTKIVVATPNNDGVQLAILSESHGSSRIYEECGGFCSTHLSIDFGYEDKFGSMFSESSGDERYRELKLFCGAIVEIVNTIEQDTDLRRTISEINSAYSNSYEGFNINYDELAAIVEAESKDVWLESIQNILEEEIANRVT